MLPIAQTKRPLDVRPAAHIQPERLLFLICFVAVVACTLAPFHSPIALSELPGRVRESARLDWEPFAVLAHFCLFFLTGSLLALAHRRMLGGMSWIRVVGIAAVGCAVLETLQSFEPARHARISDLMMNTVALSLGGLILCKSDRSSDWRRRIHSALAGRVWMELLVLIPSVLAFLGISLPPLLGSLNMNWDRSYPLTIANEIGGARPWLGQVRFVGIYDRAVAPTEIRNLRHNLGREHLASIRHRAGLALGYDFTRLPVPDFPPDGTAASPELALNLPAPVTWTSGAGITVSKPAMLKSAGDLHAITDRIVRAGAFSVEFWGRAANLTQAGPARLVSNSWGPALRNFTIGQSGADIVFRVRNRVNQLNGTVNELTGSGLIKTDPQHLVAVYDHGVSTIYVDGKNSAVVDLREPIYYSGLATGALARLALLMLAVTAISLPALSLFGRWFGSWKPHLFAILLTILVCATPYLASWLVIGGPWRAGYYLFLTAALALVYPFGSVYLSSGRGDILEEF